MNNNKKNQATEKKHKITFIDAGVWVISACIIIVCAFALLSSVFDWQEQSNEVDIEKTVMYVVELKNLLPDQVEQIKASNKANLVINGKNINSSYEISQLETSPGSKWELSPDGEEMILVEDSAVINAFVTFEINCVYEDGLGYFLDDVQLLVGDKSTLDWESIVVIGECVAITVKE